MTTKEAQALAPSYLRLPNDGASFRCSDCKQEFMHDDVRLCFIPADPLPRVLCMDCVDEWWYAHAKDCGVAK